MMYKSRFIRFSFLFAAATFLTVSVATAAGPYQFYSVTPCRIADTRGTNGVNGGPVLSHGAVRSFAVYTAPANCGLPADGSVKAVTLNVTVVNPTSLGHLTAYPYCVGTPTFCNSFQPGGWIPVVSTINYNAGEPALGNGAIVPITNDASFQISVLPVLAGAGNTVHAIIDITGYFK
jgi:hypothetical protein